MRTLGHAATYGPTPSVTLAGLNGTQFDGKVTGKEKTFIPFTPASKIARYYGDANFLDKGEAFRIIVLKVRHKVVAIYIETGDFRLQISPLSSRGRTPCSRPCDFRAE